MRHVLLCPCTGRKYIEHLISALKKGYNMMYNPAGARGGTKSVQCVFYDHKSQIRIL